MATTTAAEEIKKKSQIRKEEDGEIIRTWGTGTGKTTMSFHIKKSYYKRLGWNVGDFLYMIPDFEEGTVLIKKVNLNDIKNS